ncbi:hypothetical protein OsJ_03846 [Oryza sativa Japonica Group]|uniref:4-hydroxy-7-methoxy-3-oxo-3,4-dihydro-2H-1,4-benzoxazin-2-yl glucosidebeta-D-glucosidase n=1 Tax=Oryza sativa subsp. japonica TaxID=39947 RepID=A2ZYX3_ORYSJ|nr:hypothetical protein OsJ_03846 [Oryza sativa Japonica Group]
MGAAAAAGFFFVLLFLSVQGGAVGYTRSDFPRDFVFGAATSAYQYDGAAAEDGRSPTIWDTFAHEGKGSTNDSLDDPDRVDYIKGYIGGVLDAIRNGVDVRGYFVWSFVDVYELLEGYQSRSGLYRVDFDDGARPRRARRSARWYSDFLKGKKDPVLIAPQ